jgi:hypothetical protein
MSWTLEPERRSVPMGPCSFPVVGSINAIVVAKIWQGRATARYRVHELARRSKNVSSVVTGADGEAFAGHTMTQSRAVSEGCRVEWDEVPSSAKSSW